MDAKLKVLLNHLDVFIEYMMKIYTNNIFVSYRFSFNRFLETKKEWFSSSNYRDASLCLLPDLDTKENIVRIDMPIMDHMDVHMDDHIDVHMDDHMADHHMADHMADHIYGGTRIKIEID